MEELRLVYLEEIELQRRGNARPFAVFGISSMWG